VSEKPARKTRSSKVKDRKKAAAKVSQSDPTSSAVASAGLAGFDTELMLIANLKPHPRNYRVHPPEQLAQIGKSIELLGFYRNIVVAAEGTILAGHGVVEAARLVGRLEVPVIRVPLEPNDPLALKLLTGDNELSNLAEVDDRLLTELLKEVMEFSTDGLMGTGFDESMLANLIMVTRPKSEIQTTDHAREWVGMPEFVKDPPKNRIVVHFENNDDREAFGKLIGQDVIGANLRQGSIWYPFKPIDDLNSVRLEQE